VTFDSLTFVVFLAAIFGGYWAVRSWTARKVFLLSASYLFYAAWNPFFVLLIIATTGFDWLASHWMDRVQHPSYRRAILASSIAINLGSLGFFKYAQFFADNAVDLLVVSRWRDLCGPGVIESADVWCRLAAPDFPAQPAHGQWAPHDRPYALIEREWHQLPLEFPAEE